MATSTTASVTLGMISANGKAARGTAIPLSRVNLLDANGSVIGSTIAGPDGEWRMLFPVSVVGVAATVTATAPSGDIFTPPGAGTPVVVPFPSGFFGRAATRASAQNRAANLVFVTHSHGAGQGSGTGSNGLVGAAQAGFVGRMAAKLTARGIATDHGSVFGEGNSSGGGVTPAQYDARVALGSGWAPNGDAGTFGGRFIVQPNGAGNGAYDITPGYAFTKARVWYAVAGGSASTLVLVDGVQKAVIDTSSGVQSIAYTDVVATGTKLSLKNTGGATVYITGVEFYRAGQQARIVASGWCGAVIGNYTSNGYPWDAGNFIPGVASDLGVLYCMTNDINGARSAADWKVQAKIVIQKLQQTGEAIIVIDPPGGDFNATLYQAYADAANQIAAETGCGVLDLKTAFGSYAASVSAGTQYDTYHPNGAGYEKIANLLVAM